MPGSYFRFALFSFSFLIPALSYGIIHGSPATDASYDAVVAFTDLSNGAFCSGVLVDPRLVITAAHCLTAGSTSPFNWPRPDNMRIYVGPGQLAAAGNILGQYEIEKSRPSPEWVAHHTDNASLDLFDIGYVILKTPLNEIQPFDVDYDQALTPNTRVIVAGFGPEKYPASSTDKSTMGSRSFADLNIAEVLPTQVLVDQDASEQRPYHGDSGGPMILAGTHTVVAITTKGGNMMGPQKLDMSTLIAPYVCWIERDSGIIFSRKKCQ